MKIKHEKLLQAMLNLKQPVITAKELALLLNVSIKSIKNYVAEVNSEYNNIIFSSNKGYSINKQDASQLLKKEQNRIPQSSNERIGYILNCFFTDSNSESIDLFDISESLFVSYETVKKDFITVKRILSEYHLFVKVNESIVTLEGSELDKRKFLSHLISDEFSEKFLSMENLSTIFPDYDIFWLSTIIRETCKDYHYFINEYALMNLVLEIVIGIDRMKNKFDYYSRHIYKDKFGFREMELTQKIVVQLEEKYEIEYTLSEIDELMNMLISSLMKIEYKDIAQENLQDLVGMDCIKIVAELKGLMNEWDFIDMESEDFTIKFTLHIKNLLIRLKNGYVTRNPLTKHIKTSCPLIFEYAVEVADKIRKITGYLVDDQEIAFLALHIGCIIGENDLIENKINCILLFPQYYDLSTKLLQDIQREFHDTILVKEIITNLNEIKFDSKVDLLISTNQIEAELKTHHVLISPFFNKKDKNTLLEKINELNINKKKENIKKSLELIMDNRLFSKNTSFCNESETVSFITKKLVEYDYVSEKYFSDVMEREKESSTAFGRIAVPHSFQMNAKKTGMFVLLTSKGINWGDSKVNIVLLFAINKNERALFYEVFENLIGQLLDPTNANLVLESKNASEFKENILSCLTNF